ncbi:MAG: Gfo/Idh/MocA family oxidoreductase [Pirellulales bacterium]|nr:Gfo/Idh/MocA family oxidoreductase [Pirellulales bacterium]
MNNLSPEEKQIGKENFQAAIGSELTRREFLLGTGAAIAVSGAGLGGMYFKYTKVDKPVRIGFIGTGDEGGVLIGALNPSFVEVAAIADIRPYNVHRAFHGDWSSDNAMKVRTGLMAKYGWKSEDEARKKVPVYGSYEDLIKDQDKLGIEAVIIALPLHLHAPAAILAMNSGLHVLTEKLMGHSVAECKDMGRVAKKTGKLLATGHQRHYSILYDNAVDCIRQGLIGDIHHIRAQWHRKADTWSPPLPSDKKLADQLKRAEADLKKVAKAAEIVKLQHKIAQLKAQMADISETAAKNFGYQSKQTAWGYEYSPLEELIRWRLWQRTGGGLMAELGSHQLDASGIFISAMGEPGKKALPLSVTAVGGRHLLDNQRECEDHVYCMFEFPRPGYFKEGSKTEVADATKKVVVTYSSINGNGYGDYGEVVMGDEGTLVLLKEQDVMLYKDAETKTSVGVVAGKDGKPVLDTTESGSAVAVGKMAVESGPVSRGYTEEIEHWAWCIRNPSEENQPKCKPSVALGDAVIALTSNVALSDPEKRARIDFKPEWFDIASDETPDGSKPTIEMS